MTKIPLPEEGKGLVARARDHCRERKVTHDVDLLVKLPWFVLFFWKYFHLHNDV